MEFRKTREGSSELLVPSKELPEHARRYGFYNPEMETDRDISVSALSVFREMFRARKGPESEMEICDLLCATGARGIRYKKEVGGIVAINDVNEKAIELAGKNAAANGADVEISNSDANLLLSQRFFDVIDIDPFGSPYPFIDSAARSISDFGLILATATDTAALFGVYPEVSERRYGIQSRKCGFSKELGTRILASFVIRELAKYNICFTPVLCYSRRHYVRVMGICEKSAEKVEALMKKFDFLYAEGNSWAIRSEIKNDSNYAFLGKVYLGPLSEGKFCSRVLEEARKRRLGGEKIVASILNESDVNFYYESDFIEKLTGKRMKITEMIFELQKAGFLASRTVFSDTGIKTSAGTEDIRNILREGRI